ncbi:MULTISPECIES: DUF2345 domain-containing protein [unclassified Psychrobacter]|uniref:DUF2345 domain-containing protein n=2 Tax=Psychrobacter TaxID=497 RepID=UPI000946F63C|nr:MULTISPECIES: DUF2345 domain-containing protein [unclassified Psychrobacter]MDN5732775.1 DUF2345 domain-containing protein [Psychrobacter sp.]OLF41410.1 hypothetical protein BTV99_02495 [Psychrobacter sp. Rd 27.2]PJX23421.1 hypothetical protein CAP50_07480 [Psychrobacter sp. L7]
MLRLTNTIVPMHADRLYASEGNTQAAYASAKQQLKQHKNWLQNLIRTTNEAGLLALLNANNSQQHGIDTYVLHIYIHERHHPPFMSLDAFVGSSLTLSFDTPSGHAYRHLYITALCQLDHDGSYGYYRLIAQPATYRLHQHLRSQIDTDLSVQAMVTERVAMQEIDVIDDSGTDSSSEKNASWTPARMTQWQSSDWSHICERLSRQGLTAYLRHAQTEEHAPPTLIITSAHPSDEDGISQSIGSVRYQQVLHDRAHAPILALSEQIITQPSTVTVQRFNSASVAHPVQSANIAISDSEADSQTNTSTLTIDTPAAFAPVTDTETIDDATIMANSHHSRYSVYHALAHCTDLNVADTFTLVGHNHLNQHYRATHIVHLARNSLAHVTGLTISRRHQQRHASDLKAGTHLTQLRLITADTPWVGALYSRQALPPATGLTDSQSDTDSRNHMTPTRHYLLDSPAQPINRLEAQAGSNYGSHFTHRADDQTLMQAIGDSEHLTNTGSLLSSSRPSLFATDNEQAVESGYRNTDNGLSEWVTDHRTEQAYSQLQVDSGKVSATIKMGVINPADNGTKREGISATTNAQINIKSGEALALSTQPQTHAQTGQHNYQHHTPTLTQTSLGGQHLAERLTQLATGLGRQVNDHNAIKTQLETIAEEQQTKTHQTTPFTLIDSAADTGYVSDDLLIHRSMGEMIMTSQQDMLTSSGDSHNQVSSESLNIVADGQFSMTNAKDNITLSAHTGKLEATAKQDVNIASSTKEVEIVATNKITLTAGGASITLDGGDITITAKQFTEKAGKHSKAGGGVDGQFVSGLPSNILDEPPTFIELNYLHDDETPVSSAPYRVEFADGSVREGILDENGFARLEGVPKGQAHVYYGEDPADFKPDIDMEDGI